MAEQPIRVPSGGKYGERKELREQQQAAPVHAEERRPTPTPNAAASRRSQGASASPIREGGIFGPTDRPDEPMTQGAVDRILPDDDDELLRALYRKNPHRDELRRLLEARDRG